MPKVPRTAGAAIDHWELGDPTPLAPVVDAKSVLERKEKLLRTKHPAVVLVHDFGGCHTLDVARARDRSHIQSCRIDEHLRAGAAVHVHLFVGLAAHLDVDHHRCAAGIDLIAGKIREIRHHGLMHEAGPAAPVVAGSRFGSTRTALPCRFQLVAQHERQL